MTKNNRELIERAIGATVVGLFLEILPIFIIAIIPTVLIWWLSPFGFLPSFYVSIMLTMTIFWLIIPLLYWLYKASLFVLKKVFHNEQ